MKPVENSACQPDCRTNATKLKAPGTVSSLLILTAVTLGCLLPFIGKAFHIDDPLFVWCARHLQTHPVDFYGFNVNWEGHEAAMSSVTRNPPLACYYLALIGALAGWSEVALHAGFLLPALAVVIGTFFLARNFCSHPLWAALVTVTAPVFVLTGTSVMCDMMMMAFWVWSVHFWVEGLETGNAPKLWLAALLMAACSLTKYFGLSLIPLLLIYSLWKQRRPGRWLACLALPVVAFASYHWLAGRLYGHGMLLGAISYATHLRVGGDLVSKILAGLAFGGGCLVVLLPAAPCLWGTKGLVAGVVAALGIGCLVVVTGKVGIYPVVGAEKVDWLFVIQISLFVIAGISLLFLAAADLLKQRTPASALLFFWVMGTFIFASVVNWTVSGRNILPLVPAVSLLLVRRLEARRSLQGRDGLRCLAVPLGVSLGVALLVTHADYVLANSARTAASVLMQQLSTTSSGVGFEGHWGFQYYMEQLGATALDRRNLRLAPNEAIVVPLRNSYLFPLPAERVELQSDYRVAGSKWLATMNPPAGYYSDGWGPLPFAFCSNPPQEYLVLRVR